MLAVNLNIRIVFNTVIKPHSIPARQLDVKHFISEYPVA